MAYVDDDITIQLDQMAKASLSPQEYKRLEKSYAAGYRWTCSSVKPSEVKDHFGNPLIGGPFLGKVMLWKLQVGVHRDVKDFICCIINSGEYNGGACILPDLGVKLK